MTFTLNQTHGIQYIMNLGKMKFINEPQHEISNNVVCANSKDSDLPARMRRLIRAFASGFEYSMTVKLLTKLNMEFLS